MSLLEPKSIIKHKELPKSMDFKALKREGVEEVQRLSGRVWTDYNEHDPGVTILENLCYALTELGYKTNFPIKDLFFKLTDDDEERAFLKTFYSPDQILPPAPVTSTDFRKLVIDHVKGVKNVWINPKRQSQVGTRINGLYEVLILIDQNIKNKKEIQQNVEEILNAHRNLGEDYDVYRVLEFEDVYFEANINISPDAIGESVYAEILNTIESLFSPNIPFYSEQEVLEMENGREIIKNHPPVKNGYVLDKDLEKSQLNNISKLFTSNIIKSISDIPGVEEVFDFCFIIGGVKVPSEIIQLDDYKVPLLAVDKVLEEDKLNLIAGDINYNADLDVVKYTYEIERNRKALKHKRYNAKERDEFKTSKTKTELEDYVSIQNSFPKAYGITDFGIEGKVSDARQAQVKQLRAYLFFFEQLMANYLAQLSNVDKLFSTDKTLDATYFHRDISDLSKFSEILKEFEDPSIPSLSEVIKKFDNKETRRNRILDHMLARFGEEFLLEAYNAIHRESSFVAKANFQNENIDAKIKYLNNYIDISRNKSKGFNYLVEHDNPENVSGLKKKIALLFNFKNYGFKRLDAIASDKSLKITDKKSNPSKNTASFNSNDPNFLGDALAFGLNRNNYRIVKQKEKEFEIYFENKHTQEEHKIYKASSIIDAEDALSKLIEKLSSYNEMSEGFHVLEHILLRDVNAAFRFIYISEDNVELISDFDYTDSSYSRTEFVSNLLTIGVEKSNYNLKKEGDLFYFIIAKKSSKFNVKSENFSSKKDAESAVADLITELKGTKIIDNDLDLRIHLDQDMSNVSIYDEDPYSLQVSFLCPRWSGRFRSQKMKYLFENVVKLNAPAHLRTNFHWLSIQEMKQFEVAFEKWLQLKQSGKDRKQIDKISSYLLMLLRKFGLTDQDKDLEKSIKKMKTDLKI